MCVSVNGITQKCQAELAPNQRCALACEWSGSRVDVGERIMAAQRQPEEHSRGVIGSAKELARSANLDDQQLGFLARSGALYRLAGHRHQAHWDVTGIAAPLPLESAPDTGLTTPQSSVSLCQMAPPCMRHR